MAPAPPAVIREGQGGIGPWGTGTCLPVLRSHRKGGNRMRAFIAALRGQGDLAMLLLRLVLASIFIVAGYNKFFGAGLERVTQMFTGYGVVPVPAVAAPF